MADIAMEALSGSAYVRDTGVERLFRDIQAADFHRPQARANVTTAVRWPSGGELGS